ncbi:hypothetical protein SHKM778_64370 [Streptomyces sp. KM77-8]|uniref:Uncharacterized protein n=1 Tax=Streptomyces haneummycinicus TaxID=3074435 RepID=A0AAT9HS16_9ACTN
MAGPLRVRRRPVGLPSADRSGYAELAADPKLAAAVTVMVDDPAQLDLIDASRGDGGEVVRVCLELDTSLRLFGGRVRIGARRSPLRSPPRSPSSRARWPGGRDSTSSGSWRTRVMWPVSVTRWPDVRCGRVRCG